MADFASLRAVEIDNRLALEQERASLALSAAGMGEFEWNPADDRFLISRRMAEITGLPAGRLSEPGREALFAYVHPDDQDKVRRLVIEALETNQRFDVSFRMIRPDTGEIRWVECAAVNVRGEKGEVTKVIGVVRDVTARRMKEEEREALVAELDHRVMNVLASVQSLAAQSARRTASLDAFLKTFSGRLDAMAAAHTLLTSTRWRGADIGHIAAAELAGLAFGQARWEGPEIILNPRATNALTLALHELGTNAVKYGALSSESGRVELSWRTLPDGGFELTWVERDGPLVSPPTRQGFGATLLEKVTGRELGGSAALEFHPQGVRATLIADASARSVPASAEEPPLESWERPEVELVAAAGASTGDAPPDDIRGVKVLIVEDAVLLALELEAGLIEAGAQVVGAAASLEEALQMLTMPFDVAVLDANLNGRSVRPVAEALRARGAPFIFASGYDEAGAAPEGFNAPLVRKPYNVRQIAAAMVQAMRVAA